ncbi:hypothetical protein BXZ70DRAFT_911371 [Cristinia sonorae]|uniref:Uncharacterized protein n=1 Tax=Cristinia sonorae TaxID=1940300 RepID=A0A8K0XK90_9AGAR|nr:hypothetical protein BXZ70DRAFT_911371 [Cristinia sonorae]
MNSYWQKVECAVESRACKAGRHSDVQRGDPAERYRALAIFKRERWKTWEEARVLRCQMKGGCEVDTENAKRSSGGLAPNVPLATSSSGTNVSSHGNGSNASQSRKRSATTQGSSHTTDQRASEAFKRAKTSTTVQSVQRGVEGSSSGKPFVYRDQSIASLLRQLKDSGNPVYCHKCMDNASQPVPCTRCTNYLCTQCCVQLELVLDRDDLYFMCHQCETAREGVYSRYYGVFYLKTKLPFFKQKGKQGLTLTCKGYGPRGVRWLHPKVAVIDARLACIDGEGHPPSMVTQYLGAMMHEIKENVQSPEDFLGAHQVKIEKLTKEIKEFAPEVILFFVETHSNDENGDLSYAPFAATDIQNFFDQVLGENLLRSISSRTTHLFLLCCGGITNQDSMRALKKVAHDYEINNVFIPTAPKYFPALSTPSVLHFAQQVIIHGHPAEFQTMLPSPHFHIGQQTGIIHLARDVASEYLWSEDHVRPNGVQLPLQCKDCGAVHAWDSGKRKDETIVFKCTAIWDRELGIVCRGKFISESTCDPIQNLHTQPLGTWISKPFMF